MCLKKSGGKILNRIEFDMWLKAIVLCLCTLYIGMCVYSVVFMGKAVDLPDWIISILTMVILYFFRKSPSQEGK